MRVKKENIKTPHFGAIYKKLFFNLCFVSLLLVSPLAQVWAESPSEDLKKAWLVRYQVLPQSGHVFLSVEWSYLDLSGKEDDLLKRGILVVEKEPFWQRKRKLKRSITLEGVTLDLEVTASKNPHPYPNAPEYLPRVVFWVDGKKKGDFHFGEFAKGDLFTQSLEFQMFKQHLRENIIEMKWGVGLRASNRGWWQEADSIITDDMIQSDIYRRSENE
ncbi:MAG: hypothetical protein QNL04_04075 [SAR324 cluster bacterium]|nr:hypothetical protein [SAR324 cluster bacterium]